MIITAILFILASSFCFALLTNRRFENFVFPALAADVLILFFLSMFNRLQWGMNTIIVIKTLLIVSTILFFAIKKKNCWKNFKDLCFSPGLLFIVISVIVSYYFTKGQIFSEWDEFSWWGRVLKSTFENNAIPLISGNIKSEYLNYPPGHQLWTFLWLKVLGNGYQEAICYFSTNLLTIASFTFFFKTSRWVNFYSNIILGVALWIFPFYLLSSFYSSIYVDLILGIVFGIALFLQIEPEYDIIDAIILLLVCSFLLLIKRSAAFLVSIALIMPVIYFLKNLYESVARRQNCSLKIKTALLYFLPCFSYLISIIWALTFKYFGPKRGAFEVNKITLQNIFDALYYNSPERSETIIKAFLQEFFVTPYYEIASFKISLFGLVIFLMLLLLLAVSFYSNKEQLIKLRILSAVVFVGFIVYSFSLMLLYIFIFSAYEGVRLASFNRYENTYIVGLGLFVIGALFNCPQKKYCNFVLGFSLFLIPALFMKYSKPISVPIRIFTEISNELLRPLGKNKKIWGIHQGSSGLTDRIFSYDDINRMQILSIGKTSQENDIWRMNISKSDFIQKFKDTDYCYLMQSDKILIDQYGEFFQNEADIKDNTVFTLKGDKIVKVPIQKFIFNFEKVSYLQPVEYKNTKTFFSVNNNGQVLRMLPQGSVTFKNSPMGFDQPVKKVSILCNFITGDADLTIVHGNISLGVLESQTLHNGFASFVLDRAVKQDDIRFIFTNKGNKKCNMLIKRIEFEFFTDEKVSFTPSQPNKLEILTLKDFSNAVPGTKKDSMIFSEINTQVFCNKYFYLPDSNPIQYSMTVKNIGKETTQIYTGFAAYNKFGRLLWGGNYPYQQQLSPFSVLVAEKGSSKIKVKGCAAATKDCMISMDADIPCMNNLSNKIVSVSQMPDGNSEILLNMPLVQGIVPNSQIRICGANGSYLYKDCGHLKPGEERTFSGKIHRDDNCFEYTSKCLAHGMEYIKPIVLSYSINGKNKNTIEITNFKVIR